MYPSVLDVAVYKTYRRVKRLQAPHWIAYRHGAEVLARRVDGSDVRSLHTGYLVENAPPLSWSRNGRTLFHAEDGLQAIDFETGDARALRQRIVIHSLLQCSPENDSLLFLQFDEPVPAYSATEVRNVLGTVQADGSGYRQVLPAPRTTQLHDVTPSWTAGRMAVLFSAVGADHELWIMNLDGGDQRRLGTIPHYRGMTLSPDASRIACGSDSKMFFVDTGSGRQETIEFAGTLPSWSPDGTRIAFMENMDIAWVGDANLTEFTGIVVSREERKSSQPWNARAPVWSADSRLLWCGLCSGEDDFGTGIIDMERREVWFNNERWSGVAFRP